MQNFSYFGTRFYQSAITYSENMQIWATYTCSQISKIFALAQNTINETCNDISFLYRGYKAWLIGSVTLGAVFWGLFKVLNNANASSKLMSNVAPSNICPTVTLKTSLNYAILEIIIPPDLKPPLDVTFTFCVDVSTSMDQPDRIGAVKTTFQKILSEMQEILENGKNVNIYLTVITFNEQAKTYIETTQVTSTKIADIRENISKLAVKGDTSIASALAHTSEKLVKIDSAYIKAKHIVILLTDGEDKLRNSQLENFKKTVISVKAQFFVIGIGECHNKDTMKLLVKNPPLSVFKATYIDTTVSTENSSIERKLMNIYNNGVSFFIDFTLSSKQLSPGMWTVNNAKSCSSDVDASAWSFKEAVQGKPISKTIKIGLSNLLDLSKVVFELTFKDYNGNVRTASVPWIANSIIDPQILYYKT